MNARKSATQATDRLRSRRRFRSVHRWLGIASVAFVVLLAVTGVALNHSSGLGLDERFIGADWLLDWYGIDAPLPEASFAAGAYRLTLVGDRLFLDDIEVAQGVGALVGGAAIDGAVVAATDSALLFVSGAGQILDRLDLAADPRGMLERIGASNDTLVVKLGGGLYAYDERTLGLVASKVDEAALEWAVPSDVPAPLGERLDAAYRGAGITMERFLYDLHSGRILSRIGPWFMDLIAGLLIVLAGTGLYLWLRR